MVAPERYEWLQALLRTHKTDFCLGNDRAEFVLQANPLGFIQFTHRTIHYVWLLGWVMWKEMYCWSSFIYLLIENNEAFVISEIKKISGQQESYQEADTLYSEALAFLNSEPMDWNCWPTSIPKPSDIESAEKEDWLIKDLVHHAIAFFLLHELRHLILHREQTTFSSTEEEELECDSWAAKYLLELSDDYARSNDEDATLVKSKRAMGVALGTAVIAHIQTTGLWETGMVHPPITERIQRLVIHLELPENDHLWNVASSFLLASLRRQEALPHRIEMSSHKDLFDNLLLQQQTKSIDIDV